MHTYLYLLNVILLNNNINHNPPIKPIPPINAIENYLGYL